MTGYVKRCVTRLTKKFQESSGKEVKTNFTLVWASISAPPFSTRTSATPTLSSWAHKCMGVRPFLARLLTLEPCSINSSDMQRGIAILGSRVSETSSEFQTRLSFFSGNVQWSIIVTRGCVNLGAVLPQQHNNVGVAQTTGDVQRSLLLLEIIRDSDMKGDYQRATTVDIKTTK
uniref:Uncharacterized protein n=1 Tax=Romanomermis culicivorax TaxID=13658 RepID=A0A915KI03_ROMCU